MATAAAPGEAEQGAVTGEVPLTPVQRWFFEQDHPEPHHWSTSRSSSRRPSRLDADALERAAAALLAHHDALRMRYARTADGWAQRIAAPGRRRAVERIDLSARGRATRGRRRSRSTRRGCRARWTWRTGPLVRFAAVRHGRCGRSGCCWWRTTWWWTPCRWPVLARGPGDGVPQARPRRGRRPPGEDDVVQALGGAAGGARPLRRRRARKPRFWLAQGDAGARCPVDGARRGEHARARRTRRAVALDEAETRGAAARTCRPSTARR